LLCLLLVIAALAAPASPTVHVMIHVPLANAPRRFYHAELSRYGRVIDHFGAGTWTDSGDPAARIVAEGVDHIEVITTLRSARAFLPAFLHRLRIAQHQHETLGEIFGGAYGSNGQTRTRFHVTLKLAQSAGPFVMGLHRIFANNGDGGDSEYADMHGVHVYSGVRPADAPRIAALLAHRGIAYATEPETFITDDEAEH
jgi:hypothetical protein